jgi:hypothetical protein
VEWWTATATATTSFPLFRPGCSKVGSDHRLTYVVGSHQQLEYLISFETEGIGRM